MFLRKIGWNYNIVDMTVIMKNGRFFPKRYLE
jgi:hypothetical protein